MTYEDVVVYYATDPRGVGGRVRRRRLPGLPLRRRGEASTTKKTDGFPKGAERRTSRRARQLGLALYEGVPLRTLKTLIPTRRLRVRPLDAARFDVVTSATFVLLLAAQRLGTVWGDVAASVAVVAWVSRLLFATKARRNMYELETTRALRDRVRAKHERVCDALARDAAAETAALQALCLGALRGLTWGEYDDVDEATLADKLRKLAAPDLGDPATRDATANAALETLPDLEARGLVAASRGGGAAGAAASWRAAPGPESDARLAEAWARVFLLEDAPTTTTTAAGVPAAPPPRRAGAPPLEVQAR